MSDDNSEKAVSRRGFLRAAAGTAAVAGAAGNASAQEEGGNNSSDGGGGGGGGSKTVEVGPGGDLVFTPGTEEPLYASPGTTVTFTWGSDNHNIVVDSQPDGAGWEGSESLENEGFTYEHTFDTLGTYEYHCQPHASSGMTGEIVINESGAAPAGGGATSPIPDSAKVIGIATTIGLSTVLGFAYFFMKYGGDYEIDE
ncbi:MULTISPECIES: plastocyanin/azurin family copper-binding protein [unclassified Haladaptatus]|uniref:plastocyanin/azurin family copper-binding protein n=1 Tax=unclassified Haladaptatus TaxID=2622732 RepID=UPI002FCDEB17